MSLSEIDEISLVESYIKIADVFKAMYADKDKELHLMLWVNSKSSNHLDHHIEQVKTEQIKTGHL